MSLKRQLLDAVKAGYSDFNEDTDGFSNEFEGSGDSFGSFCSFDIWKGGEVVMGGSFDLNEHSELLHSIIDASGVDYNWNDGGTQGKIQYDSHQNSLTVETQMIYESWAKLEDEE